ncbi:MAG TPA: ATP-dependent metallopeptidase FtsH/Yme1/Tma family protein, partial [Baekduia sp.]|nr:ATP-dependent metallopeptidase FtsH/Yme1/Tma family protein [Baekduia sp.]
MSRFFKSAAFPILIVVVLAFFAQKLISTGDQKAPPSYGEFIQQIQQPGVIKTVDLKTKDNSISVTQTDGKKYETGFTDQGAADLSKQLEKAKAEGNIKNFDIEPRKSSALLGLLTYVLPFVIFIAFWIFLMNQVQGGGSKVMSFGKSRAKRMSVDSPKITFRDVAGVDEAVEELHEIKEFLENPKKFQALGARIPKGVLLFGPPGTGKT